MRKYVFILTYIMLALTAAAQKLTVNAPAKVQNGETFRLEYSINTTDVGGQLHIGSLPDALEVVYGPSVSQQESYSMVNGHVSSSASITYTYMVQANKNGTFTIPAAQINVGGQTLTSNTVKVTVTGAAHANNNQTGPNFHRDVDEDARQLRSAGSPITHKDLFIRVSANKTRVHEQEPVLLTYKVYTLVDLTQLEGKMPDLKGFHTQEVPLPQQKSFHTENVDGRNYRCVTWSQYVMYPQMTGKLEIPSIVFRGIVVQENRNVDPFEAFFNGGSGYVEVKREIEAPGITITVDSLPSRPAGFSGGVGRFNLSAQINKEEVSAGDPVTLRVVVSGVGNLKLLKQPQVEFPKDFEKYDPKVTDKTKLTANGVEGNMVYDFLVVPRNQGEFTIPAVQFTYYDTGTNSYKTLKSQTFKVKVEPGDGTSSVSDFTDNKNKDIHDIMRGKAKVHQSDTFFFASPSYWVWIILPFLAFIALLWTFRHRAIENANIGKRRGKQANKVATKRLRGANKLLLAHQKDAFYDEVLRALWGYVGDKFNMPVEQLSRDNIHEQFTSRGVDDKIVDMFINALDECEFERYAPGDTAGNMNKTFETAMTAIMRIEDAMKSSRKAGKHATAMLMLCVMIPLGAQAITKENADAEYLKGNYQQAIKDYEELLKSGVSPELYYNLGNAYYRSDNITKAIINYERAYELSPGDEDIRFNLQLARSKTIDKITPASEMFFVTWYHALVHLTSVDRWAYIAIFSIIVTLVLVLFYLFGISVLWQKIGFYGAILFFILFILSNVFAFEQKRQMRDRKSAIITSSSVNVLKSPSEGAHSEFVLHEGTKVNVTDTSIKGWKNIRVADGREGWVKDGIMEEI